MPKLPDTVTGARVLGSRMLTLHRESNPEGRMPLMDHLRELRSRIIKAVAALLAGTAVGLIPRFIEHPFCQASINHTTGCRRIGDQLVVTGIFDPFTLRIQIAFIFGLVVSSPVWLYQIWAFVAPGLYAREKRWTYAFVGTAVPLFATGAALAYIVMDRGLKFLLGLAPHGTLVLPSINTYLGYVMAMVLGFGLTFELPLAMVMLNYARVLTHERFRKWRRMMIFGVFVFAGIATPSPDPLTMLMLAAPCVLLVELAEVIVWAHNRNLARRPDPYAGLSDDEAAPLDLDDRAASGS
jgi:sec-independent protein translocase protein TatC